MKVITLLNEKGGVGKTTVSRHVAAGLAIRGNRVLMIDADAQANSTRLFNLPQQSGVYDLIIRDAEWNQILKPVPSQVYAGNDACEGELFVLPSNMETSVIPMLTNDTLMLAERLQDLRDWADYVVIDTSPTPSMLHAMIFVATDYVIYPTKCEYLSLIGVSETRQHMEALNEQKHKFGLPSVHLLGIQPTMYDVRTNAHDYGLSLLRKEFGRKVWPALPTRTIWRDVEYADSSTTIFGYDAPDRRAKAEVLEQAWAMVDRIETGVA